MEGLLHVRATTLTPIRTTPHCKRHTHARVLHSEVLGDKEWTRECTVRMHPIRVPRPADEKDLSSYVLRRVPGTFLTGIRLREPTPQMEADLAAAIAKVICMHAYVMYARGGLFDLVLQRGREERERDRERGREKGREVPRARGVFFRHVGKAGRRRLHHDGTRRRVN